MPVKFVKLYTKELLKENQDQFFVFGDNYEKAGRGGQAKACRDEPNAIGVPTKKAPNNLPASYLSDDDFADWMIRFNEPAKTIVTLLKQGKVVNFPEDGLGTGLAKLPERSPKIFNHINGFLGAMVEYYGMVR